MAVGGGMHSMRVHSVLFPALPAVVWRCCCAGCRAACRFPRTQNASWSGRALQAQLLHCTLLRTGRMCSFWRPARSGAASWARASSQRTRPRATGTSARCTIRRHQARPFYPPPYRASRWRSASMPARPRSMCASTAPQAPAHTSGQRPRASSTSSASAQRSCRVRKRSSARWGRCTLPIKTGRKASRRSTGCCVRSGWTTSSCGIRRKWRRSTDVRPVLCGEPSVCLSICMSMYVCVDV